MVEIELLDIDLNRNYTIHSVERSSYLNGVTFYLLSYTDR
jgi:hypothetical protein